MKTVEKRRHQTRHGIHFTLTIFTFGVWSFTGWPLFLLWNKIRPRQRIVTKTDG